MNLHGSSEGQRALFAAFPFIVIPSWSALVLTACSLPLLPRAALCPEGHSEDGLALHGWPNMPCLGSLEPAFSPVLTPALLSGKTTLNFVQPKPDFPNTSVCSLASSPQGWVQLLTISFHVQCAWLAAFSAPLLLGRQPQRANEPRPCAGGRKEGVCAPFEASGPNARLQCNATDQGCIAWLTLLAACRILRIKKKIQSKLTVTKVKRD
jgi:hypothetical protein